MYDLVGFFQYGIVLDAGPSHTTLFIYQWSAKKENNTGVVSEHSTCTVQGKIADLLLLSGCHLFLALGGWKLRKLVLKTFLCKLLESSILYS